ncbi:BofC C-terminal domain-containing protein [Paramaledivibacter caminithermalis]|uniref:BofC C-terminal domain-containing protein n=1 Tax=Paramaledivibacter caminithermalis (strain DSM 15212 / CIP 107654 / DViRD3) TaxID=1121301 RepID=A0A1M6QUY2_PARC5|nr:BofC C-terminal domain-containing protein [Paramaledivibacter caminithermalis]SHK24044.1 BofC C-terminal domain-containing protein [Paramaledivibacter caminithermalis DSM 15212]
MFYRKKKNRSRIVVLVCAILLFASFTYGYISNNKPLNKPQNIIQSTEENNINKKYPIDNKEGGGNKKIKKEGINEYSKNNESNVNDCLKEVNENSKIVFNTYYSKTGKMDTKQIDIPITIVGASLDEFKSYIKTNYSDWKINSISTKSASLFKEVDGYNPDYFIVQNKNGYITVYKINKAGEKELYEETDISISTLSEMDKKKLNEGIIAKDEEELYRIIEDYSS